MIYYATTRAELAKELRNLLEWLADKCEWGIEPAINRADDFRQIKLLLEDAAAALEEEERDARRYLCLKCVAKVICDVHSEQLLVSIPERRDTGRKVSHSVWETIDAALDAWLEEREKKGGGDSG